MDPCSSRSGSTTPTPLAHPLQPLSLDRVNQQLPRDSSVSLQSMLVSPTRNAGAHSRGSSVNEKISQFNTMAMQSKALERKTADAALKRAMLGREEAEAEMRRYRDELKLLRKQADEGKERERRVGERLETVLENYGRAKETHAHTQALWEKEIRRTRKETFKSQSTIVKLQEELKSARAAQKLAEESLEREKERSSAREQEAFTTRYNLVGVQEVLDETRAELDQSLERLKVVEQERDAFKTLAKTEEDLARIASEGKLPLPPSNEQDGDDEFASPKKETRVASISTVDVKSSASSEAEIEELTRLWQWERQRADRASDQVEYLHAECLLRACSCMKKRPRTSMLSPSPKRQKRPEPLQLVDPSDRMILSENATMIPLVENLAHTVPQPTTKEETKGESRRATIFLPDLGTFRTVSMQEAEALERAKAQEEADEQAKVEVTGASDENIAVEQTSPVASELNRREYTRSPSAEPPSFALLAKERASLSSLLDAPHGQAESITSNFPTTTCPALQEATSIVPATQLTSLFVNIDNDSDTRPASTIPPPRRNPIHNTLKTSFNSRPHTTTSFYYQETTTTTVVPLREETQEQSMAKKLLALQRTPSRGGSRPQDDEPSFDVNNPALTPTMTREQALAKIRERRGRAKSVARGTATPHKRMIKGVDRRDMSAPVVRKGRIGS